MILTTVAAALREAGGTEEAYGVLATSAEVERPAFHEPWDRIAAGIALTASIGVATAETAGDLRALTELADQRLYEAKRAGRDRVVA